MQTTTWIYIAITALSVQANAPPKSKATPVRTSWEPAKAKLPQLTSTPVGPLPRSLNGRIVRQVVRERRASIARCYERSLKRDNRLSGKLAFVITVAPTGAVQQARLITKQHTGTTVASCIERKLTTWRFPAFMGEAQDVLLPFRLERG